MQIATAIGSPSHVSSDASNHTTSDARRGAKSLMQLAAERLMATPDGADAYAQHLMTGEMPVTVQRAFLVPPEVMRGQINAVPRLTEPCPDARAVMDHMESNPRMMLEDHLTSRALIAHHGAAAVRAHSTRLGTAIGDVANVTARRRAVYSALREHGQDAHGDWITEAVAREAQMLSDDIDLSSDLLATSMQLLTQLDQRATHFDRAKQMALGQRNEMFRTSMDILSDAAFRW